MRARRLTLVGCGARGCRFLDLGQSPRPSHLAARSKDTQMSFPVPMIVTDSVLP